MEVKKTDKANLEKNRGLFLQLGYVIVLGLVLLAFEWGTRPSEIDALAGMEDMDLEEEINESSLNLTMSYGAVKPQKLCPIMSVIN